MNCPLYEGFTAMLQSSPQGEIRTITCNIISNGMELTMRTGESKSMLRIPNDAAWELQRMISALHPSTYSSNDPLFQRAKEIRKQHAPE